MCGSKFSKGANPVRSAQLAGEKTIQGAQVQGVPFIAAILWISTKVLDFFMRLPHDGKVSTALLHRVAQLGNLLRSPISQGSQIKSYGPDGNSMGQPI